MPNMNGWDAARLIRSREDAKSQTTPIYALTAHALPEEQKALLDAGMVGCILKPLRERALEEVLQFFRSEKKNISEQALKGGEQGLVDETVLSELRDVLGPETFAARLEAFLREVESIAYEIGARVKAKNWDELAKLAHKFTGSAALFGAIRLTDELRHLEIAAKSNSKRDIAVQSKKVESAIAITARAYNGSVLGPSKS